MRSARAVAGALAVACAAAACAVGPGASNSAKMGEALAFVAAAAAAQVVESAAEQRARNNAPVGHASYGVSVSPGCDNEGQYGCVSVAPAPPAPAPEADMDDADARDYVLGYVNGVRRLNGAGPLARDGSLDAFAQAGSDELSRDHRPGRHIAEHAGEIPGAGGEVQGPADGSADGPLQDRIADVLLRFTGEGPGGMHHDTILRPEWRKLGVGIAHADGRTYLTIDFSS